MNNCDDLKKRLLERIERDAEKDADANYNVTRLPGKGFHGQDAFEADSIHCLERNRNYRPSFIQGYKACGSSLASLVADLAGATADFPVGHSNHWDSEGTQTVSG